MYSRGFVLLAIQAALVLSAAGKYQWERHTRPMIWVQAEPWGQGTESGKYLGGEGQYVKVQLYGNGCKLSTRDTREMTEYLPDEHGKLKIPVRYLEFSSSVRVSESDGKLVLADPGDTGFDLQRISWDMRLPCTKVKLDEVIEFYVPDSTRLPLLIKPNQTVWALVTVPKQGPPRPLQLAISDATGFHPLGNK